MTDLINKTAQSLHDKWCEQMRERGWHGPDKDIENCTDKNYIDGMGAYHCQCDKFSPHLAAWDDLFESRRQEYLATAKAVLPEIVGEVFEECVSACAETDGRGTWSNDPDFRWAKTEAEATANYLSEKILALRDRRLEELEK